MQVTTRGELTLSGPSTIDLRVSSSDYARASSIEGRVFVRQGGIWRYPLRAKVVDQLLDLFPALDVDPRIVEHLGRVEARDVRVRELKDAGWEGAVPVAPIPLKTRPYQHQVLAFNLCMELLA